MATSPAYKFSSVQLSKLNELRGALLEGIRKCGEVVLSVNNEPLRKTILNLEQQSNQYANELNMQIKGLGGKPKHIEQIQLPIAKQSKKEKTNIEKQALKICRKIEGSVISLYRKMLREELKDDEMKKMIQNQMNGMMCTTLQLKLLSKFLHNQ